MPFVPHNFRCHISDRQSALACREKGIPAMKKFFQPILCLALLVSMLSAQEKTKKAPGHGVPPAAAKSAESGLPPIIDRELIFGNPEIAAAELSPNGKYIA